jgi:hypothetical protein
MITRGRPASCRAAALPEGTMTGDRSVLSGRAGRTNLCAMAEALRSGSPARGAAVAHLVTVLAIVGATMVAAAPGGAPAGPRSWRPEIGAGLRTSAPQVPAVFTHADHEGVQCYECHDTRERHGAVLVTTLEDCRTCHHDASDRAPCARCHSSADAPDATFAAVRAVAFTVGTRDPSRALAFPHVTHAALDCAGCHTQGTALTPPTDLDCAGCHQDHHTPQSDCASCHRAAPVEAHPPAEAHVTCSGAACHQNVPFRSVPRTRDFCLGCHRDMREHEAPRACAECHALPAPRPQNGGME